MAYTSTAAPGQPWSDDRKPTQQPSSAIVSPPPIDPTNVDRGSAPYTGPTAPTIQEMLAAQEAHGESWQAALAEVAANQQLQLAGTGAQQASLANDRARLAHQQRTGLRDIGQSADKAVEAATEDVMQRGIYNSGIRKEMHGDVREMETQAKGDLRAEIGFAMKDLSIRAQGLRERISAIRNASAAQRQSITAAANERWNAYHDRIRDTYDINTDEELARYAQQTAGDYNVGNTAAARGGYGAY